MLVLVLTWYKFVLILVLIWYNFLLVLVFNVVQVFVTFSFNLVQVFVSFSFNLVQVFVTFSFNLVQAQSSDSPPPVPSLFSAWPFSWLCKKIKQVVTIIEQAIKEKTSELWNVKFLTRSKALKPNKRRGANCYNLAP